MVTTAPESAPVIRPVGPDSSRASSRSPQTACSSFRTSRMRSSGLRCTGLEVRTRARPLLEHLSRPPRRLMKRRTFPLALLLTTTAIALAQPSLPPPKRFPAEKITAEQLGTYKSEVQAIPGIECREIGAHQRQCTSNAQF